MNAALKWRLVAGFFLVFAAGIATGAFVSATRWHHFGPGRAHHRSLAERMQTRLNLTPAQVAKMKPILDHAANTLEQIRRETTRRVHEALAEVDRELAPELTAEQRTRLETMERKHRPKNR